MIILIYNNSKLIIAAHYNWRDFLINYFPFTLEITLSEYTMLNGTRINTIKAESTPRRGVFIFPGHQR